MSEIFTRKFSEISVMGDFQPEAYHYERLEIIEKLQKLYKNNLSEVITYCKYYKSKIKCQKC